MATLDLGKIVGDRGPKGDKGDKGDTGPQGIQGIPGEQGVKGDTGAKGDKGDKGDTGPQGIQGIPGEQGVKGDTGAKGDKGDTGAQGEKGAKGDPGANATINGVQALKIVAGDGLEGKQSGDTFTISATAGGAANAGAHNGIYRGKNLGTSVTAAQYAAIAAGTFKDLYIGDYWTIGGVNWRIAAFDYYLNCGDQNCTTHHVVIVPDTNLYNAEMNAAHSTEGGYAGSLMYSEGLERARNIIKAAFNGHVLNHRVYLTNAVTDGHPSAGAWCDSEVELMNEQMVYGGSIFMPIANGSTVYTNYRVEKSQLPLFALEPSRICNRTWYWLRDVVSASHFAFVDYHGRAACDYAGASDGVRPAFCIS